MSADLTAPAYSAATERTALGLAIANPGKAVELVHSVGPEDYATQTHANLHELLGWLLRNREPTDLPSVVHHVVQRGADRFGGVTYVAELCDRIPSGARAMGEVLARLQDAANRRRLARLGEAATRLARGEVVRLADGTEVHPETGQAAIDLVSAKLGAIPVRHRSGWSDGATAWRGENEAHEAGQAPAMWPTGFPSLDGRLNGGPRGGQLLLIGGRPGQGKTAMATGLAVSLAVGGHGVGYFPMEVTPGEWQSRCISILSGMPFSAVLRRHQPEGLAAALRSNGFAGWETTEAWETMLDAEQRLDALPLHAYDAPHVSLGDVVSATRRLMARSPVRVVVVDYLQRMKHRRAARTDIAMGETVVGLKNLARELGICVVALVQLNRGVDGRRGSLGKRGGPPEDWLAWQGIPRASDIREVGQAEQEADAILFPVHPAEETLELPGVSGEEAAMVWAKNRNGPVGIDRGWSWDGSRAQYVDTPPGDDLLP